MFEFENNKTRVSYRINTRTHIQFKAARSSTCEKLVWQGVPLSS